jgi:membrane protein YdbS with pleckstrin-like domain
MAGKPDTIERASAWIYSGLWGVLTRLFLVPREPPSMPAGAHEIIGSFRPSPGYLRYVKMFFWIGLVAIDLVLTLIWIAIAVAAPLAGAILAIPALIIIVLPDILAYIAIHLRYDTTWYVLTDRSMRLRRGVLLLNETTITYENVQNVTVEQGPIQRVFGIADLVVQTAGGGGGAGGPHGGGGGGGGFGHLGRIVGVDNAHHIRDLIMTKVRASRSAGLGDEHHHHADSPNDSRPASAWTPAHLAALRQIRDALATAPSGL